MTHARWIYNRQLNSFLPLTEPPKKGDILLLWDIREPIKEQYRTVIVTSVWNDAHKQLCYTTKDYDIHGKKVTHV